jgi:cytochrome c5
MIRQIAVLAAALSMAPVQSAEDAQTQATPPASDLDATVVDHAVRQIERGRFIFRQDTFGDQAFWGGKLGLHQAIAGEANGGSGRGLTPKAALRLGLKVDVNALPAAVRSGIRGGDVDLEDPATTLVLLQLNAVIGVKGFFDGSGQRMSSVGITCALCHSTVDNSFAPGIGNRRDGWANRDLDVGRIIALSPSVQPFVDLLTLVDPTINASTVRMVLRSWGPGKFDAELLLDGKAFRKDGKPAATLIPPAFGLAGVNLHTWTGWGSVTHWNGLVANLEMQGQGTFFDPRLKDSTKFPVAAAAGLDDVRHDPDLVTSKLAPLHLYQLSLQAPKPPRGSFDAEAAERGDELFEGKAGCARCHVEPLFTEPGLEPASGLGDRCRRLPVGRSPDGMYRTTPLKGLWTHTKGGFFHDGRFPTLRSVVDHYDQVFSLGLTSAEKRDLVEYLKSL